jgi:hypothetical protein
MNVDFSSGKIQSSFPVQSTNTFHLKSNKNMKSAAYTSFLYAMMLSTDTSLGWKGDSWVDDWNGDTWDDDWNGDS